MTIGNLFPLHHLQLDGSLADLVRELGYSFCSTVEECRSNLGNFCVTSITPAAVAKVLGVMVRTHTGLPSEQVRVIGFLLMYSHWWGVAIQMQKGFLEGENL